MTYSINISGHVNLSGTLEEVQQAEHDLAAKVVVEVQRLLTRIEGASYASVSVPHFGSLNLAELTSGLRPDDILAQRKAAQEAAAAAAAPPAPAATEAPSTTSTSTTILASSDDSGTT